MALIVETGAIVAGAESYCSVAFANAYHLSRGNEAWDDVDDKEAMLRRATDYMMQMYRGRWKGGRVSSAQALDWPRQGVLVDEAYNFWGGSMVANTVVPTEVKNVCAELALRAVTASLAPDLARGVLSETVGPISVTYDPASPEQTRYRALDAALGAYLTGSSMMHKLVRS